MGIENVSIGIAFIAGLASFLSPCVFALVPAYVSYLSGRSAASAQGERSSTWHTLSHGIAFVLGFTFVFVVFGVLASVFFSFFNNLTQILVRVGGAIIIIFGLHMLGIFRIPFLEYDLRPQSQPDKQRGYLSSALMGVFFSAGWSPCVGPIYSLILGMILEASTSIQFGAGLFTANAEGVMLINIYLNAGLLLLAYSAGLGIPFLFAATQIGWVTNILRKYGKLMHYIEKAMGVLLIGVGVLLFLDKFSTFQQLGSSFFEIGAGAEGQSTVVNVGNLLLMGGLISFAAGLIPGLIARSKDKPFVDWWFIGSGITLAFLVVLYLLGVFSSIMPG